MTLLTDPVENVEEKQRLKTDMELSERQQALDIELAKSVQTAKETEAASVLSIKEREFAMEVQRRRLAMEEKAQNTNALMLQIMNAVLKKMK